MGTFNNLKVGTKLLISFTTMIILMAVIGTVGVMNMTNIKKQLDQVFSIRLPAIDALIEADRDLQQLLVAERSMIFTDVKSEIFKELLGEYENNLEQVKTRWNKYKSLATEKEETDIIPVFEKELEEWQIVSRKVVDSRMSDTRIGRQEAISLTRGEAKNKFEEMRDKIDQLTGINLKIAEKSDQIAEAMYKKTRVILFLVIIIGMLIGTIFIWAISKGIAKPINMVVEFAEELRTGNLNARLNFGNQQSGDINRKDEIGRLLTATDKLRESLSNKAVIAEKIANGDLTTQVEILSEKDVLGKSLTSMVTNIKNMADEINLIANGVQDGDLGVRGNSEGFEGGWKELINNINTLTEAFVKPINMTSEYINNISKGEIPEKITEEYKGDFNRIKQSLNQCVDITKGILNEIQIMTEAVNNGQLDIRGDAGAYNGEWAELVQGINKLIEELVSPFKLASLYIDRISKGDIPELITEEYKGDFNEIKNNLNSLIHSTDEVTDISHQISKGNLMVEVQKRSEKDRLMESLDKMVSNLTNIVFNVQTASRQVSMGSGQISSTSQRMSQGATEQAANVEEVSSSMEEMNSSVQQNADNAKATASIALKTSSDAEEGGSAVSETVSAMQTISTKTSIIEEIARQTNMLALNAAIEAARAGEHGKGFAVVAAEVRKLAERSQKAAQEIGSYSTTSVEISEKAGTLLDNIVPNIKKTSELVQEISTASLEQANGIQQVSLSVEQLNQIIQDFAAASEEMAATSQELSNQAGHLNDVISFFKVDKRQMQSSGPNTPLASPDAGEPAQLPLDTNPPPPPPGIEKKPEQKEGVDLILEDDLDENFVQY